MGERGGNAMEAARQDAREAYRQLIRFGIGGGLVTALSTAVYWSMATMLHMRPLIANVIGYLIAVLTGYFLHSQWSFKGHGRRDNIARTTGRFFLVSLVSLGLNSLWVWLLTGVLHGPTWWPVPFMLVVTPGVTFVLNRVWVFA